MIADAAGQAVWRLDHGEPFGVNVPDENPSSLGAFEFPLRFPGQYFDKETGLHYSYFRDCYDSSTGRFCQPDPIGSVRFGTMAFQSLGTLGQGQPELAGLLYSDEPRYNHLYSYADNNPVSKSDPLGLIAAPTLLQPPSGSSSSGSASSGTQVCFACTFAFRLVAGGTTYGCVYNCYGIGQYTTGPNALGGCAKTVPGPK